MDYGSKFKVIRLERGKTQQDIADYIGKSNMLISGIETGKNKVFSDDDFLKISEYLSLTEEEKKELYKLAIISNSKLPKELSDYMCSSNKIIDLIEVVKESKCNDKEIKTLIEYCKKIMKEKR